MHRRSRPKLVVCWTRAVHLACWTRAFTLHDGPELFTSDGRAMGTARIAVIPGDGIGAEGMTEGGRVLRAAADRFGFAVSTEDFDFASAQYYRAHGVMMPDNWADLIGSHDAILFGAVGWPDP